MGLDEWYYAQNNRQLGPVTLAALLSMLRDGHARPSDLVWKDGMAEWVAASTVPELASFGAAGPVIAMPMPMAAAMASPVPLMALNYLTPVAPEFLYAGFWLRFVAYIIDMLVIGGVYMAIVFLGGMSGDNLLFSGRSPFHSSLLNPVDCVLGWLYFGLMESSPTQATLGKLALGLCVTDMSGQRISFGQASGRFFAMYISRITIYIGFMMAGWTQKKQALHDLIASCLVIRR